MNQEPLPTPSQNFTKAIDGLFALVWRCIAFIGEPLAMRTLRHIRWHDRRFAAIAAKVVAGTYMARSPRPPRPPRPARPKTEAATAGAAPPRLLPLPRRKYWLCGLLKHHAAFHGRCVEDLLTDPEMQALLAAAPRLWRHVRAIMFICGDDLNLVPKLPPYRRNQFTPEQGRARLKSVQAKAEKAALEPSERPYRTPRDDRPEPWMPHHPSQVRARLPGYHVPRSKKS